MAQARKCDRPECGVVYESNKGWSKVKVQDRSNGEKGYVALESYDLCPDCMKQLPHWLNGKGKLEGAE